VPSADGQRIAWVIADHLHTGRVSGTGVVDEHMTPVAPHSFAATWIGDRVVVGMVNANAGGGGVSPADYDIWDPTGGDFVAHWTQGLADVYGPTPPGTAAYANVQKGTTTAGCLGRLDGVADLSVREKVCLPGLLYGSPGGSLAPNGAHLVVFDQTTSSFMIIDVSTVAQTRVATGHCGANLAIAWQDNTYLIAWNTSTQELVHCDVETGVTTRAVGTSTTPFDPNRYRIVPRYGP
jgi:hypothetical protein